MSDLSVDIPRKSTSGRRSLWIRSLVDAGVSRAAAWTGTAIAQIWGNERGGRSWASQEVMARRLRMDVRTLRRHLAELEERGTITVERTKPTRDPATGQYTRRRTNRYCLRLAKPQVAPTGQKCPVIHQGSIPAAPLPLRGGRQRGARHAPYTKGTQNVSAESERLITAENLEALATESDEPVSPERGRELLAALRAQLRQR